MADDVHAEATFCFVDIAGYTALTVSHGDQAAADLIEGFNSLVRASVGTVGQVQELTGDCAFLVFPDPVAAARSLGDLYARVVDRKDFPMVRTGMHHGAALLRGGRYFGSSVNVAARVAAQAGGGEILCTREVVDRLSQAGIPGIDVRHRGAAPLRNLPHTVDLYQIVLPGVSRLFAIDPVCQMQVDTRHAAAQVRHEETTYWFCSWACAALFSGEPSSYV